LDDIQLDALRETCNIGLGHASTALAAMTGKKIDMAVPRASFLPLEEAVSLGGEPEKEVSCINMSITGDIPGLVIFMFDAPSTFMLVDMVSGLPEGTTGELDEMSKSVIRETGNILSGSFISAIGNLTGLKMYTEVPELAFDMLCATLCSALTQHNYTDDQLLLIETIIGEIDRQIKGYFFFMTSPENLEKLFKALLF